MKFESREPVTRVQQLQKALVVGALPNSNRGDVDSSIGTSSGGVVFISTSGKPVDREALPGVSALIGSRVFVVASIFAALAKVLAVGVGVVLAEFEIYTRSILTSLIHSVLESEF